MPSTNNDPTESEKEDDKEEVEADVDVSEDKTKEEDEEETPGIDMLENILRRAVRSLSSLNVSGGNALTIENVLAAGRQDP